MGSNLVKRSHFFTCEKLNTIRREDGLEAWMRSQCLSKGESQRERGCHFRVTKERVHSHSERFLCTGQKTGKRINEAK